MKKIYSALLFAALFSTGAMAQNESELITQPAAGKTVNLYRTTTGYESVYYYGIPHESTGDWQRLVFGDDGAVYLENPINSIYTKTWIKGYRAEGDTIAFQLPQPIYAEEASSVATLYMDTSTACTQWKRMTKAHSALTRERKTRY